MEVTSVERVEGGEPFLLVCSLCDDWLENFPYRLGDFGLSFRSRVDAVGLVEFFYAADFLEKKWDEDGFGLIGSFGENGFEAGGEVATHGIGHLHACEDHFDCGVFSPSLRDDAKQILLGLFWRNSAKPIIPTKGDDEHIRSLYHRPCDPPQATGGGIATDSGICNGIGELGGGDFSLEQGGVGFAGIKSVASSDTIAQDDDALGRSICIRRFLGQ